MMPTAVGTSVFKVGIPASSRQRLSLRLGDWYV
jgi:hypothetical protein